MRSLPMLQGEGAHPPADACDFARFCSDARLLEHQRPRRGDLAAALAGDQGVDPAVQRASPAIRRIPTSSRSSAGSGRRSALTPETHYGHKNVIFRDTADDQVPTRPISALDRAPGRRAARSRRRCWQRLQLPAPRLRRTASATSTSASIQSELARRRRCARRASTRASCRTTATRSAQTPRRAVREARRSGASTRSSSRTARRGASTRRPARRWDKQLTAAQHDPDAADADRGLLRPRQLRGVPHLAARSRYDAERRRRSAPRRPRTTCRAAGRRARSSARAAATRRPTECEQRVADGARATT